jgi:uncharacterized repeat protein (TIGR01451 family)
MYVDTSITPQLRGAYAGYRITNGGPAIADAWIDLTGFGGGVVSLGANEDGRFHVGPLASGATTFAYFYLVASGTTSTPQTHNLALYSGHPGLDGTEVCTSGFSLQSVQDTIKASANKVNTVVAGPNPAELGGIMTMTVTGNTGTVGAGPPGHPDGTGVFVATPATDLAWPANAYQLIDTRINFSSSGTYNDTLVVSGLSGAQNYTAVYTFVAVGTTVAPTSVTPVNYIASGTQIKHTDTTGFAADLLPILPADNKLTLAKSASPTVLPPGGGTVGYTVTISNAGTLTATLDDVVDVLPAGAVYVPGSARYAGSPIPDPFISGQTLSFVGSFAVPAGGSGALTYSVMLPAVPGTYLNQATGHVGSTAIDTTLSTTDSSPASASVQVGTPPAPPVANDDTVGTGEDVPVVISPLANDTDLNGDIDPTTVSIVSPPTWGTATVNGDGTIDYTPDSDRSGPDSFTYQVCDLTALCDTATVAISVSPVADPPSATDDGVSTNEGVTATFDLAGNDTDPDGNLDPATLTILGGPAHGTAVDNGDGTIDYTPAPNYAGPDTITYQICDTTGLCDTATVTITVDPVNDPPVANPDSISTPEDVAVTIDVAANDTDPDGNLDPASVSITTIPGNGVAVANGDGTITYTPDPNFFGTDTFEYEVCDLLGLCSTTSAIVTTNVVAVDDPPDAVNDVVAVGEDATITFDLAGNDTDPDGNLDPTTLTILAGPARGTAVDNGDGTIDYTPAPDYTGSDTITYQICDVTGLCDTATVTITINPAADNPIAGDDSTATGQGTTLTFDVTANDTDGDGDLDPASVTILAGPAVGVATNNGDGTITVDYTASPLFTGTETITYRVCDATSPVPLCDTATLSITVDDTPQPPAAAADPVSTAEDTPATFDLAGNDTDPDGNFDPATLTILAGPAHGTAVDNGDGTIDYTPAPDYAGPDTITYQICDTTGLCDTATVTITVLPVEEDPEARPDTATTAEDTPVTIDLSANDTDSDGDLDPTTLVILSGPSNGSVINHGDGTVTYTPDLHSAAPDSLTYRICDAAGNCDTSILTISVVEVNDLPEPADDPVSTDEDTPATFDLTGNDTDPDGDLDPTTLTILAGPSHGTATNNGDGTIDYTPAPDYAGPDSITYQICDMDGECATATVAITVDPVADPPVANPDSAGVAEDGSVTVDVASNDLDVDGDLDPTAITILTPPGAGTATVNPDGTITYTPGPDFSGSDSLTYRVCDGTSPIPLCDSALLTLTVSASDDPPVANPDSLTVDEDGTGTLDVTLDDTDPDGDLIPASVSILLDPANGVVVANGDGTVTYTPAPQFSGPDSFIYQVCDAAALCSSATVSVVVDPLADPPVANADAGTVAEDGTVTIDVAFNDTDPDGDLVPGTVAVISGPSQGTATVNGDGTITYTPGPDFFGTDSLLYEVCDGTAPTPLCAQATLDLTVTAAADSPVAVDDTAFVVEDGSVAVDVLANDGDVDADLDPTTVVVTTPPANGRVSVDPDTGVVTYVPGVDWSGTDTFTYQVCDTLANCVPATVVVSVSPVNDPPVASDPTVTAFEDLPVTVDIGAQVTDVDGILDYTSVRIISGPAHGSATVDPVTGAITYLADPDFAGTDTIGYLICDLAGACDGGVVTFLVAAVNDAPRLLVDHLDLQVGNAFTSVVLADPESDVFSATVLAGAVPPGMTLQADGTLTGTPTVSGTYQLTIESCDVHGACSVTVLSIQVAVAALGLLPFTGFALTSLGGSGLGMLLLGWVLARRGSKASRPRRQSTRSKPARVNNRSDAWLPAVMTAETSVRPAD